MQERVQNRFPTSPLALLPRLLWADLAEVACSLMAASSSDGAAFSSAMEATDSISASRCSASLHGFRRNR